MVEPDALHLFLERRDGHFAVRVGAAEQAARSVRAGLQRVRWTSTRDVEARTRHRARYDAELTFRRRDGVFPVHPEVVAIMLLAPHEAAWAVLGEVKWFSNRRELVKIDLQSNQVTASSGDTRWNGFLFGGGIEHGSGAFWVTAGIGDNDTLKIWKIHPNSGEIAVKLTIPGLISARLAVGERAVWATDIAETSNLVRIDSETEQFSAVGLHTTALDVVVAGGAVWVLHPDATISRVGRRHHFQLCGRPQLTWVLIPGEWPDSRGGCIDSSQGYNRC